MSNLDLLTLCLIYPRLNISDRYPSHFIFVGDKMNSPPFTCWHYLLINAIKRFLITEEEKGTSWTLFNFPIIWTRQQVQRYLTNNICYLKKSILPCRGPQTKTLFWSFFLGIIHTVTTKKIGFVWAPLQAFLDICHFFGHFHFVNPGWKYFGKEFGS